MRFHDFYVIILIFFFSKPAISLLEQASALIMLPNISRVRVNGGVHRHRAIVLLQPYSRSWASMQEDTKRCHLHARVYVYVGVSLVGSTATPPFGRGEWPFSVVKPPSLILCFFSILLFVIIRQRKDERGY